MTKRSKQILVRTSCCPSSPGLYNRRTGAKQRSEFYDRGKKASLSGLRRSLVAISRQPPTEACCWGMTEELWNSIGLWDRTMGPCKRRSADEDGEIQFGRRSRMERLINLPFALIVHHFPRKYIGIACAEGSVCPVRVRSIFSCTGLIGKSKRESEGVFK